MTTLHHIGWYHLIIANIWSSQGKAFGFYAYVSVAALCFLLAYFRRGQG